MRGCFAWHVECRCHFYVNGSQIETAVFPQLQDLKEKDVIGFGSFVCIVNETSDVCSECVHIDTELWFRKIQCVTMC